MGAPIHVDHCPHPTPSEIHRVRSEYIAAVRQLYDAHKEKFGYGKQELIIQ